MSDTVNTLKTGDTYKQFIVLETFELPDFHSQAVHLRHTKTGIEVLHLVNDETENLFAFAFRTPNDTANGAAHILEHSVLCGSEKYPLKDPFIHLSNQSVKTYLNAMTYPDRTVFPASSIVKSDYFNLMSVYGDAVFFPRLSPEIFMQEAWRPELDEHGKVSLQGVVYNEMKGSYSSFESVAADMAMTSLMRGSVYEKDSGGDPLVIPTLTHEKLVAFHERWYRPDNCLVFLYGNIPTEEQLDFLQAQFIDRLEKKFPDIEVSEKARAGRIAEYVRAVTPETLTEPVTVYAKGPAAEEKGEKNTVLVNWLLPEAVSAESLIEYLVLSGVLLNHDGSPLQKALIESALGEDVAPQTGVDGSLHHVLFTAGLRGVKKGAEERVKALMIKTLTDLAENGIPQEDITATMMSLEYSQREIKRAHGPYALRLMGNAIHSWIYGEPLRQGFKLRADLEAVRRHIEADSGYLCTLIKKLFLENPHQSLVVVTPDASYTREREKAEKAYIAELLRHTDKKAIKAQNDALHAFQRSPEDASCLPHLCPRDFLSEGKRLSDGITTGIQSVKGIDGRNVPFFTNLEHTNGIIYADVGFPADVLSPEDYTLLPLFSETATEVGWGKLDWVESARQTALYTGGLSIHLLVSETSQTARAKAFASAHQDFVGREWVIYRISMIEEEAERAFSLLADCISDTDFHDTKRLEDLCVEVRNDFDSSIIPDGHEYAALRAKRTVSRVKAVDELWNGISAMYSLHRYSEEAVEKTAASLKRVLASLRAGGAFVHVTAEQSGIDAVKSLLPAFVEKAAITSLKAPADIQTERFMELTEIEGKGDAASGEVLMTSAQVGFASECISSSPYGTKESASQEVCTHWLSNTLLWERLRTIGGAYGAFCYTEALSSLVVFATYRDPTPDRSSDVFNACLEECAERHFDEAEVEKAITGCYSNFIQPKSPRSRGSTGLLRTLYAISDDDREEKIRLMLSLTADDIQKGFTLLRDFAREKATQAIICGQNIKSAGKITVLPL
ncbi:MAG: insulinase family protein [Treponema sp.]|nr:insulinase family protein [Treponema sp.]